MTGEVRARLAEAGFRVPASSPPLAAYQPAIGHGDLILTSGQLPMRDGQLPVTGRLGADVTVEQAQDAARQATLNALAAVDDVTDLDQIRHVVRLVGYVSATETFVEHPRVLNAASELLIAAFGDAGRHVLSAVGVSSLPLGSPVEIELTVSLA